MKKNPYFFAELFSLISFSVFSALLIWSSINWHKTDVWHYWVYIAGCVFFSIMTVIGGLGLALNWSHEKQERVIALVFSGILALPFVISLLAILVQQLLPLQLLDSVGNWPLNRQ